MSFSTYKPTQPRPNKESTTSLRLQQVPVTKEQLTSISNYRKKIMSERSAPKNAMKKFHNANNLEANSCGSSHGLTSSPAKGSVIGCSEQTPQKSYADPKPPKTSSLLQRAASRKTKLNANKESYASADSHLPALQLSLSPNVEEASKTTKGKKKAAKVKQFEV